MYFLWLINHLLFGFIALKKFSFDLLFTLSCISLALFAFKVPTYDLLIYYENINNSDYVYEPVSNLFLIIIEVLSFGYYWTYSLLITSIFLFMNVCALVRFLPNHTKNYNKNKDLFLSACVIMSSLYFFLGSQNVLRQCLSVTFFLLFYAFYKKQNFLFAFIFFVTSLFCHYGNIPIVILMSFYIIYMSKFPTKLVLVTGIIFGSLGIIGLKLLIPSLDYLGADFSFSEERTSLFMKWISISFIVIITHYLSHLHFHLVVTHVKPILNLRLLFVGILTSLFLFDLSELFSRVAFNLYALDMVLLYYLLNFKTQLNAGARSTIIIFILSFAFAPSVYQIMNNY